MGLEIEYYPGIRLLSEQFLLERLSRANRLSSQESRSASETLCNVPSSVFSAVAFVISSIGTLAGFIPKRFAGIVIERRHCYSLSKGVAFTCHSVLTMAPLTDDTDYDAGETFGN
ncbi:unnamed protein product [Protopolystoma xenopodis]|uniref:Uncharacterized protein n=1 Tax=Protopolystoma xenopodis TaxID=117903 RepID=A0A3S4ZIC2_9PLAT|nr:unnamed protein product [Protopolystoma xenopodis]